MYTKKIFSFVLIPVLFMVLYLFLPVLFFSFGTLAIGGIITSGILGGFSGKVGPVVGGSWKGIDYMRQHVIPANPNTTAQQNQRGKMGAIQVVAQILKSTLIVDYWNPYYSTMSGFNAFVKYNVSVLADTTFYFSDSNVIARGSLNGALIVTAVYTTGTGGVVITWADNSGSGNALATDYVVAVVIAKDGSLAAVIDDDTTQRDDTTLSGTVQAGATATDLFAYLFFKRGTGSELIVSNSDGSVMAAP
jgi:hypothetical protein